ncbi:MAG: Ig-like domain-containing protein, partial [Verrucomicrobiota bacterium]
MLLNNQPQVKCPFTRLFLLVLFHLSFSAFGSEPVGIVPVAVHIENGFNVNSQAVIEGSVLQNQPRNTTLNSNATILGDLYMPGTPTVRQNGQPEFQGVIEGEGNSNPTNHRLTLNSNSSLEFLRNRTDAIPLPEALPPFPAQGNRNVNLNNASQQPGDFATLRNLTLNSNAGKRIVPPGAYGNFSANSNTGFILGTEGATERAIYSFNRLTLNSRSTLEILGPVEIRINQGFNLNSQTVFGNPDHPEWLVLYVQRGSISLNSASHLYGRLVAPNSRLSVNSQCSLCGFAAIKDLSLNSQGLIKWESTDLDDENTPPTGSLDPVMVAEDSEPLVIDLFAAFSDEEDADSELTYSILSNSNQELVSGVPDSVAGTLLLEFGENKNGQSTLLLRVEDTGGLFTEVPLEITVNAVNDAPVADDLALVTDEDVAIPFSLSAVDVEDSPLSYTILTDPAHGTLSGTAPNLTYTPEENFNGEDTFTYSVNDGELDSNIATVIIEVSPVNDLPTAEDITVETDEDTPVEIILLGSDVDLDDSSALSFTIVSEPSSGSLSGLAPNLTYTPNAEFSGSDTITYLVNDGSAESNLATVFITVTDINDLPLAQGQSLSTDEDAPVHLTLIATDTDDETLTYSITDAPENGALSGTAPNLIYTPDENFFGEDQFTFTASDGTEESAPALVQITINPINDAPVAENQDLSTDEDTELPLSLQASDIEGEALSYSVTTAPEFGVLSGSPPNLTYTPNANYFGPDSFTYQANDGELDSDTATISITVNPVNDEPVSEAISIETNEDEAVDITLIANDIDEDSLIYQIISGPGSGSLSGTAPDLVYTPAANFNGTDTFTFQASDGLLSSESASVVITVVAENDPPTTEGFSVSGNEDTPFTITLEGEDLDGDSLIFEIVEPPSNGALSGSGPEFIYSPEANFAGNDQFTFLVNDGTEDSNTATVLITVLQINDLPTVSFLGPQEGDQFELGDIVPVQISAADIDGDVNTVTLISIREGTEEVITELSSPPFNFDWTSAPAGTISLKAVATD